MSKQTTEQLSSVEKPHHTGHRQRLRDRFLKSGPESVQDYELLELVLFRAVPRRDIKPLAKMLLNKFGSFSSVINAPTNRLREFEGVGDSIITEFKVVAAAALKVIRTDLEEKPTLSNWDTLIGYCKAAMAHETREQFRIIFLDKRNRIIEDEVQQQGTVDHTPVYIREITRRALELSATAIILVHNHPSGDPTPSRADIEMTKKIVTVSEGLGIVVHDHLIIGREGHASFRHMGLI